MKGGDTGTTGKCSPDPKATLHLHAEHLVLSSNAKPSVSNIMEKEIDSSEVWGQKQCLCGERMWKVKR